MYVCMYACMYVCMHVCMYVRMYICMHACMHVCMYVCMYDVYVYIYTHTCTHTHTHTYTCLYTPQLEAFKHLQQEWLVSKRTATRHSKHLLASLNRSRLRVLVFILQVHHTHWHALTRACALSLLSPLPHTAHLASWWRAPSPLMLSSKCRNEKQVQCVVQQPPSEAFKF